MSMSSGGNNTDSCSFKCLTCHNESTGYYCNIGSECIKCGSAGVTDGVVTWDKGRIVYATEYNNQSNKKEFSSLKEHDYLTSCEGRGQKKFSREKWLFGGGRWGGHNGCYDVLCRENCATCVLECFICEKSSQFKGSKNLPNQCSCGENELFTSYYFTSDDTAWNGGREYIKGGFF